VGNLDTALALACLSGQLAVISVGLAIGTTDWFVLHGAHHLAGLLLGGSANALVQGTHDALGPTREHYLHHQ